MAIITDSKKRRALKLLAQGRVTVSEMSRLAGISQQMMHTYARQAGIDPVAARRRYLEDLWQSQEKPAPKSQRSNAIASMTNDR